MDAPDGVDLARVPGSQLRHAARVGAHDGQRCVAHDGGELLDAAP
jgi:hypothetical protein